MTPSLALTDTPTAAEEAAVRSALREANEATGFPHDSKPLAVLLRDAAGAVVGGLWGRTGWSWLYVENLAVPPALRGEGFGGRMLAMAEAEARMRGCIGARLDTYSFQARGFYEGRGYALAGAIEDCPPGQTRFTMVKRLDGVATAEPWPDAEAPRVTITANAIDWDPVVGVLEDGLTAFNAPFAGTDDFRPLNLVVRRLGDTHPVGGLSGHVLYRWFFVRLLYLPEDLRGDGLGAALMRRAEAKARAAGCIGIWLDTFGFQARPFYERLGYRVFATLDDFPPGHARHYLMKRLDRAPA
ncbi:MAG TPA: GNAT family N-acetyltransferase [Falsiroseomonas sp.]|nr:GNAT family N-acetyltransferase [Falsiroseomonas sp.]